MRFPHNKLLAIFAAAILALLAMPGKVQAQTLQIDSSTANWIEGFTDFVRWAESGKPEQITIGIVSSPEVARYLTRRVDSREGNPELRVVNINPSDSFEEIDILFVGSGLKSQWDEINRKCAQNEILSISAQDGFVQAGGCVEFVVRKNRLRFYINRENLRHCGIEISSKLLELALEPKK
ncbi:hypothetical protein VDG1235_644 [Verrucomicrobiia bacterium DG1235]|nr:hypothetical protein VDG1235_644 [Verrucomicrobiae bacterium DG1235]